MKTSSHWFTGCFNDPKHMENWSVRNFMLLSKKVITMSNFIAPCSTMMIPTTTTSITDITSKNDEISPLEEQKDAIVFYNHTNSVNESKKYVIPNKKRFKRVESDSEHDEKLKPKHQDVPKRTKTRKEKKHSEHDDNDESEHEEPRKKTVRKNKRKDKHNIDEEPRKKKLKKKIHVNENNQEEWKWWQEVASKHVIEPIEKYNEKEYSKYAIIFDKRRVLYFRTFYYLKRRLPDGTAIGNARTCKKVLIFVEAMKERTGNLLPPFILKKDCVSEQERIVQAKKVFGSLWFHCVLAKNEKDESQECDQLVVWRDLYKNNEKDLVEMVKILFKTIANGNSQIVLFLQNCMSLALSKFHSSKTHETKNKQHKVFFLSGKMPHSCNMCSILEDQKQMTIVNRKFELILHPKVFANAVGCNLWTVIMFCQRADSPTLYILHNDKAHITLKKTVWTDFYVRRADILTEFELELDTCSQECLDEINVLRLSLYMRIDLPLLQYQQQTRTKLSRVCVLDGLILQDFDFAFSQPQLRVIVLHLIHPTTCKTWNGFLVQGSNVLKAYKFFDVSQQIELDETLSVINVMFHADSTNSWQIQKDSTNSIFEESELLSKFSNEEYYLSLSHNNQTLTSSMLLKSIASKQFSAITANNFIHYSDVVLHRSDDGGVFAIHLRGSHPSYICVISPSKSHYLLMLPKDATLLTPLTRFNTCNFDTQLFVNDVVKRALTKTFVLCDRDHFVLFANAPETLQWQQFMKLSVLDVCSNATQNMRITLLSIDVALLRFKRNAHNHKNNIAWQIVFYCAQTDDEIIAICKTGFDFKYRKGVFCCTSLSQLLLNRVFVCITQCNNSIIPANHLLPIALCEWT